MIANSSPVHRGGCCLAYCLASLPLARCFDFPAPAESLQVFPIDDGLSRAKTIDYKVTATDEISNEGLGNAELLCGLTHR
jgi:hypothetical protein